MQKDEITEPKEHVKREHRAPVEIKVDLSTLGVYYLTKILNLSTSGAFICHEDIKPIGTIVNISFKLPTDSKIIQTEAKVAWSYRQGTKSKPSGTGMGLKFTKIDPVDQKKIETYIQELLLIQPKKKR
jgi:Tfp pilus assembly protein PilZ